jgi:hypothetical protein
MRGQGLEETGAFQGGLGLAASDQPGALPMMENAMSTNRTFLFFIGFLLAGVILGVGSADAESPLDRMARVFEVVEWSFENPGWSGNPFDLPATSTCTHDGTGRVITTPMFYDGGDTWRFRFTPTRPGRWTFATSSPHAALAGHRGTVEVAADPEARGFLVAHGTKFARQVGDERTLRAAIFNVYTHHCIIGFRRDYPYPYNKYLADWERHPDGASGEARDRAREAREHGMNLLHLQCVANEAFAPGVRSHRQHKNVNPEISTFRILDQILRTTHEEGIGVHFWWWGDEDRRWTPVGIRGGINGPANRRLQRYIAARLAPLPGWTMSYGCDLHEANWTGGKPELVRQWHEYLNANWGWEFYRVARARLAGEPFVLRDMPDARLRPRPVLLEMRFLHTRHDVWDGPTTRRAMWQFILAGGAGAVWGRIWGEDSPPYDARTVEQLRCFARFWRDRWQLDLEPAPDVVRGEDTVALADGDQRLVIVHSQDADSIALDFRNAKRPLSAVAVDTTAAYQEIELGTFQAEQGRRVGSAQAPGLARCARRPIATGSSRRRFRW